jgi:hypothetical protein
MRLLAGEVEAAPFAPVAVPRLNGADAALAGRALGCPDLFVIDCAEAGPRERHLLNIVRVAAGNGERLLVLSPDPAAADRLVEALASDRSLRAVRALSDDENPVRPMSVVTRLTTASVGTSRAEQLRREAGQTVQSLEAKLGRIARSRELQAKLTGIEHERASVLAQQAAPSEPPPRCLEIQTQREEIRARRMELEQATTTKSGMFARLFGVKKPAPDHSAELNKLAEQDAALVAECASVTRQRDQDFTQARETKLAAIDAEATKLDAELRQLHPQAATEDTVDGGSRGSNQELERELIVARTRLQELTAAGAELPRRLLAESQVVVGTPGSLESDPVFVALGGVPFDRLLLDHAEELTESAFDRLAPLASKWILAGDAGPPPPPVSNGRSARPRRIEPSLLHRVSRSLDREPWRTEADKLVVHLVHPKASQRSQLSREPLIDHPDVEVGVVNIDGEMVVAEISFPAFTTVAAAKSFLFVQLGEVVLRTCGEPQWRGPAATWPLFESADGEWIDLEPGVREKIVGRGSAAFTAAIEFDFESWDEATAREWLASRISHSASRVAICDRAFRHPAYSR